MADGKTALSPLLVGTLALAVGAYTTALAMALAPVQGTALPSVQRTIGVGRTPVAVAVDPRTRHVFVASSGANSVSMLDAARGTVLRTIAVGRDPSTLAIDTARAACSFSTMLVGR